MLTSSWSVPVTSSKLGHVGSGPRETKAEIKGLSNKMERKCDRLDGKMDCLLYAVIGDCATFLLKGGFDSYMAWKKQERSGGS